MWNSKCGGIQRRDPGFKIKKSPAVAGDFCLLVKENHQPGWWFQKALAMPKPAAAVCLPLMREVARREP